MNKTTKSIVIGACLLGAAGGAWAILGRVEKKGPGFQTAVIERGTVIQNVTTTGSLTAVTTVKVGSQVSGIIATLHADFNDRVTKNQIVATLDPTPFEAQVNQTQAQLERTRVGASDALAKLKRQKALAEAKLISEDQLESAKALFDQNMAQVTELEASLSRAKTNLAYSVIRSPIDGVVVSRDYDVGQTVAASFQAPTLFTIAEDLTRMQLTCDVDEADIGQVKVDQPTKFSVDAYPEREFLGKVAQIRLSPKTVSNVVTYPVIVEVDNRSGELLPGMTAEVRIQVAEAHDVLRVPAAAMRFRPELLGLGGGQSNRPGGMGPMMMMPFGGPPRPGGGQGGQRQNNEQKGGPRMAKVWVPTDKSSEPVRSISFRPGLTDGAFTEVREGEVTDGMKVIVGMANASGQGGGAGSMGGTRR